MFARVERNAVCSGFVLSQRTVINRIALINRDTSARRSRARGVLATRNETDRSGAERKGTRAPN